MTPARTSRPTAPPALGDFWDMDRAARETCLLEGIQAAHIHHFERNMAYRATVAARGVGLYAGQEEMPRLLRTTTQGFKSYVDILGTPFPQDRPADFADWFAEQLSLDLRSERRRFRRRYWSMEELLRAVEHAYPRAGLEVLTSCGTSGRTAVIPRDEDGLDLAAESFGLCFERYLGLQPGYTAIFLMPRRTRLAVPRMVRLGVQRVGPKGGRVHFTFPLADHPDRVRLRAGAVYRRGVRGAVEKHVSHRLTATLHSRILEARALESAVARLVPAAAHGERVLLFGGTGEIHRAAQSLLADGRTLALAPGSVVATCGGPAESSRLTAAEVRSELHEAFRLTTDEPVPIRDIYALAEANWAAVQCEQGNYHIPPWVHAVVVDDQEAFRHAPRAMGLLAFFDPYGGGDLFPAFFRTTDRVTLVREPVCPCGEPGAYLEELSIRRIDLTEEAGWAGLL